jgi:hypothetical protein
MGKTCSMHEYSEKCTQIVVRKRLWKRQLGRPRQRCEDDINMEVVWIQLAQDKVQ